MCWVLGIYYPKTNSFRVLTTFKTLYFPHGYVIFVTENDSLVEEQVIPTLHNVFSIRINKKCWKGQGSRHTHRQMSMHLSSSFLNIQLSSAVSHDKYLPNCQ